MKRRWREPKCARCNKRIQQEADAMPLESLFDGATWVHTGCWRVMMRELRTSNVRGVRR